VHSEAGDHALGCIRENAVYVTLGDAADVHLHIRQARTLDTVLQCLPGVGKARRVHDEPVRAIIHRPIDAVDRLTLDIRVEDVEMVATLQSVALELGVELRRVVVP
jgi:hypothetical protein